MSQNTNVVCMCTLHALIKTANLIDMKQTGLKLLTIVTLLVHLIAPAQAVVSSVVDTSEVTSSHCMEQMNHNADSQMNSGNDCCQQAKACDAANCNQCQSCAAVVMLVNLHHQTVRPALSTTTSLMHVAEYLQGITAPNLYRPPITSL